MPNWATNKMRIHKDDLHNIVRDGEVDFNLIRPMPKSLEIGGYNPFECKFAREAYAGKHSVVPNDQKRDRLEYTDNGTKVSISNPTIEDYRSFGKLLCENIKAYGHECWYDWATDEDCGWGTKWSANSTWVSEPDEDGYRLVQFSTAWNQPSASMMDELFGRCGHPVLFECMCDDGDPHVYDEHYNEVDCMAMLFDRVYHDEDWNVISEADYMKLSPEDRDDWSLHFD